MEPFAHAAGRLAHRQALPWAGALQLAEGRSLRLESLRGRWALLYLGFASCPDLCPSSLGHLAEVLQRLRPEAAAQLQGLFVSLDPGRDTPERLATYASFFHPSLLAGTAPKAELDALVAALGTRYAIRAGEGESYVVDHPALAFLLDPEGRLAATYRLDEAEGAEGLLADFPGLLASAEARQGPSTAALSLATGPRPAVQAPLWCGLGPEGDRLMLNQDPLMQRAATLGSGTSILPAASPMRMWALREADWLWMAHAQAFAGLNHLQGPRGGTQAIAPNAFGVMGSRFWGPALLDLNAHFSLDPLTLPASGRLQAFQQGETYQFRPLIDAQHPHDLLMALNGRLTWPLGPRTALYAYGGPVGEPALGPPSALHRPSSADSPSQALGHHLQDGSHVAYGVGTLGLRHGLWQWEASLFNGKEGDERRWDLEWGPWDSWSTRLWLFPGRDWVAQASYGQLKAPERAYPGDVHRSSASLHHSLSEAWGRLNSGLIWGHHWELHQSPGLGLHSFGLESQWDGPSGLHLYGRAEALQRQGLAPALGPTPAWVAAGTLGATQDLGPSDFWSLAVGAEFTWNRPGPQLAPFYGENPWGLQAFLRLRPPTR